MIGSRGIVAVLLAAGALALVSASAPAKPGGEGRAVGKVAMGEGVGPTVAGPLSGYWVGGTGRAETWAGLYHESDQRYTAFCIGHLDKHTAPFAIAADKDGSVFFQIPTGKGEARRVPVEKLLKLLE